MKNIKVNWFFGPKEYVYSGIYKYSNTFITFLKKNYNDLHIKSHYFSIASASLSRKLYQFFIFPLQLIIFYRKNINVFVAESFLLATIFPFFPYKNSIIIIHDFRDFYLTNNNPSLLQKIKYSILKYNYANLYKFKHCVFVSFYTYNLLTEKYPKIKKNGLVIENSFTQIYPFTKKNKVTDRNTFLKKFNINNDDDDKKIVLIVSSEEERKNIPVVIKAAKELPNILFIKVGKAIIKENRKKNRIYIKENTIDNFYFVENITESDLNLFYFFSDVFVFPSSFEGFGRPPIEAQIMRTPVISSGINVLKEHLRDGALYLENEKNAEELVKKIKYVINNKNLEDIKQMVNKGILNAKRFTLKKNALKFYNLLTS